MTTMLNTPEQINAWVLLSRRSQLHLHLQGVKVPGIVKWCKANIPAEYAPMNTAKQCLVAFNDWVGDEGLLKEDQWCSYKLLIGPKRGVYIVADIFPDMAAVEAEYYSNWNGQPYVIGREYDWEVLLNG